MTTKPTRQEMSEQADDFLNSVANYKLHLLTRGIDLGYWAMKCRADGSKLIQAGVMTTTPTSE